MPARKVDRAFGGGISSLKRNAKTIYKAEGRLLRSRAPRRTPHRGVEQGERRKGFALGGCRDVAP
jgi:hypothetical protein